MAWSYEPIRDCRLRGGEDVRAIFDCYRDMHGFMAGHLYRAYEVLREGLEASELRVISFTGNLVATGLRGVLADLIRGLGFNVVITTTGAIDHDIARSSGGTYLKGFFEMDDSELYERGYHRLGNVLVPRESYGPQVESFVRMLVSKARSVKEKWGVYELLRLAGEMIEDEASILRAARDSGSLVFVPGWPDGAFGTSLFMELQAGRGVLVDYTEDMKALADIFFTSKGRSTALILGGGISKHHTIWWSQFAGGLDYVVYVTTASEYDGSLSGAHPREAVSWGKVKTSASKAVVYGDATIIVPLLASMLLSEKRVNPQKASRR